MQNDTITYTQHTGEVVARGAGATARAVTPVGTRESVHEACCPTGTREGSHGDGFVGVQKAVRTRENRVGSAQAGGRSMIEMIGVLAIIGVLSVGALSGYRMAMTHYRANEIVDYIMRVGEGAVHHGTTQKTGSIPYEYSQSCPNYVNEEEPPFGLTCNPWNHTSAIVGLDITNFPSADVANAVKSRIGTNSNKPVYCGNFLTSTCPSKDATCRGYIFFKK